MERLPGELCLKIFCFLDHQNLASAQQVCGFRVGLSVLTCSRHDVWCCKVCRKWRTLGADNTLWSNLFKERWGDDRATFYAPVDSKSWKDVYEVQDRCDRVGLGLKIVREGVDYYLIHQGEIQRYLGSRRDRMAEDISSSSSRKEDDESGSHGILDRILFFIGDLEVASMDAKRSRIL